MFYSYRWLLLANLRHYLVQHYHIFIADLASGQITHLTGGVNPKWSPVGSVILFEQYVTINPDDPIPLRLLDLFRINADGSELVNLTQTRDLDDQQAIWSPDGTRIAFSRYGWEQGQMDVVVMQADGSNAYALTEIVPSEQWFERWDETGGGVISTMPAWSPDGTFLALVRYRKTNISELVGIYLIRADGSGEEIPLSTGGEGWPAWQPQP